MAQRRMISKTISTSRKVNRISDRAALIFTWLIPHTDDFGRMEGDPASVLAIAVPKRKYKEHDIELALSEMEQVGLIKRYWRNNEQYLEILGNDEHQTYRTDRPRRADYPEDVGQPVVTGIPPDTKGTPVGENSPRKLSEVKLSEVKIHTLAPTGGADEVINAFKEVNPSYRKWYANKTQRGAAVRLVATHGRSKVLQVISYLPQSNRMPFFPSITTPLQLEDKWAAWEAAKNRKGAELSDKKILTV